MHKPSSLKDYLVASFVAIGIGAVLLVYWQVNRGYMNLSIANKALAGTAALLLGIVYLIGPIARHMKNSAWMLQYRKEIGVVAAVVALAHVLLAFIPFHYRLDTRISTLAGGLGILVLVLLWASSRKTIMSWLGGTLWWKWQRWGLRISIGATFLHVLLLKYTSWKKWFISGGSADLEFAGFPPAGLLITLFILWVVIIRIYEYAALYPSHHVSIHNTTDAPLDSKLTSIDGVKCFILGSGILLVVLYIFLFWRWLAR